MPHTERREKRSKFKDVALSLWLETVAERNKILALLVADSVGLLVAVGAHSPETEELAAIVAQNMPQEEDLEISFQDTPIRIRALSWMDETLYIAAKGDTVSSKNALDEAVDGVLRILS